MLCLLVFLLSANAFTPLYDKRGYSYSTELHKIPPELDPSAMIDIEGFLTRTAASKSVRYAPVKDTFTKLKEKFDKIEGTIKLNELRAKTLGRDVIFSSELQALGEGVFCNVALSDLIFESYTPHQPW